MKGYGIWIIGLYSFWSSGMGIAVESKYLCYAFSPSSAVRGINR